MSDDAPGRYESDSERCEYPTESRELDATTLVDMMDVEAGEELWLPVSPIRANKFRAVKVRVLDRVSVNNYEEHHAIDKWPQSDRHPISHEWSDGNPTCDDSDSDGVTDT